MARTRFSTWKKDAPKVPGVTCPEIDKVLDILEKYIGKGIEEKEYRKLEKKLEKLRSSNELLRESGEYWYGLCKEHFKEIPVLPALQQFIKKFV